MPMFPTPAAKLAGLGLAAVPVAGFVIGLMGYQGERVLAAVLALVFFGCLAVCMASATRYRGSANARADLAATRARLGVLEEELDRIDARAAARPLTSAEQQARAKLAEDVRRLRLREWDATA